MIIVAKSKKSIKKGPYLSTSSIDEEDIAWIWNIMEINVLNT